MSLSRRLLLAVALLTAPAASHAVAISADSEATLINGTLSNAVAPFATEFQPLVGSFAGISGQDDICADGCGIGGASMRFATMPADGNEPAPSSFFGETTSSLTESAFPEETPSVVALPASVLLLVGALGGLALVRRKIG